MGSLQRILNRGLTQSNLHFKRWFQFLWGEWTVESQTEQRRGRWKVRLTVEVKAVGALNQNGSSVAFTVLLQYSERTYNRTIVLDDILLLCPLPVLDNKPVWEWDCILLIILAPSIQLIADSVNVMAWITMVSCDPEG